MSESNGSVEALVVVGASAGGLEPLVEALQNLPKSFPGAVLVVLHVGANSFLPDVLERKLKMPVSHPVDGQHISRGQVYVAPPDRHLVVEDARLRLTTGPRENRHRPAIDVLFRSASRAYRERVVGVVLSGWLDDGTAGLFYIKARGGLTVVQDPEESLADSMPRSAIHNVEPHYVLSAVQIGEFLARLPVERGEHSMEEPETEIFSDVDMVCPDCNGPLTLLRTGSLDQFRCQVGHQYSPESLDQAHHEALERALWIAIRTLDERHRNYAAQARSPRVGSPEMAARLRESSDSAARDVQLLKQILEKL
jgi:two-component system chemotaxis response regulator CheB